MHKFCFAIFTVALAPMVAQASFISGTVGQDHDNAILVGSSFNPHNDNPIEYVNDVIGDIEGLNYAAGSWNAVFGPGSSPNFDALPLAGSLIAKYEHESSVGEITNVVEDSLLTLGDFEWFAYNGSSVTSINNQTILNYDALAFRYIGGDAALEATFSYYVAKSDGQEGGFSVWRYRPGAINLMYVDNDGDLDSFDPRANQNGMGFNISHVSIYGAVGGTIDPPEGELPPPIDPPTVPEPSSVILLTLGAIGMVGFGYRRRKSELST